MSIQTPPETAGPDGEYRGNTLDELMQRAVRDDMALRSRFPEWTPQEISQRLKKPYRPLVDFRHYGSNAHWSGKGSK